MKNEAQEYAETIAREVRALETALRGRGADGYQEAIEALEISDDDESVFHSWLNEIALDVSVRVDVRGADHGFTVIVLRTVGGPRCEVVFDSHDGNTIEVLAWWSGEVGRVRLGCASLAECMRDLVGVYA